jgi:hypothetical protein
VALVCGIFTALLASGWAANEIFFSHPEKPVPPGPLNAVVQLSPGHNGECERFEFDNQTGRMRPQARIRCGDFAGASPSNELNGQLTGVRDYFNTR